MFESFGEGAIQPDSPPPTSHQSRSVMPKSVVREAMRTAGVSGCAPEVVGGAVLVRGGGADGLVVLGRAVGVVGEFIVERARVKLRRRLILFRPRAPAVEGDVRAAVIGVDHARRVVRRDPEIMIVAMRHGDACERAP